MSEELNNLECNRKTCPLVIKLQEHEKKINSLEEFEKWARPILEKIQAIEKSVLKATTSINWMIVIFGSFVAICSYVYQTDIKDYIKQSTNGKIEVIKEIYKMKEEFKDDIRDMEKKINEGVIQASKINHKATVRKIKEVLP